MPADHDRINSLCRHGLCNRRRAQGFGGTFNGRRAGTLAEIMHLFPTNLWVVMAMVVHCLPVMILASLFRSIRVHGQGIDRYENVRLGTAV